MTCRVKGLDDETQIVVGVASVAVAIDAGRSDSLGDGQAIITNSLRRADLPGEVLALERVARRYTRSPIVRAIRLELRCCRGTATGPQPQGIGGP